MTEPQSKAIMTQMPRVNRLSTRNREALPFLVRFRFMQFPFFAPKDR